jgi:hypothetical protein
VPFAISSEDEVRRIVATSNHPKRSSNASRSPARGLDEVTAKRVALLQ